jgi:hypothetical protein
MEKDKFITTLESYEKYRVTFNDADLGTFERLEDGYYRWFPNDPFELTSDLLKQIANALDELNKEWDDNINEFRKYLEGLNEK